MSEAPLYSIFIIIFIYTVVNVYQNYKALEHQEWMREYYHGQITDLVKANRDLYLENIELRNVDGNQNENRT